MKLPNWCSFGVWLFVGIAIGVVFIRFSGGFLIGQPTVPKPKISDGPEINHRQPVSPDLTKLYPKLILRQGNPKVKTIALTFDDGPDFNYTPKILDVLKKYNVKATFFVVGTQIQKYPATFRRMIQEGHEIGSHGFQHLKITELTDAQIRDILNKNNNLIMKQTGTRTVTYRPPYGALDPHSIESIGKYGYKIVLWTIDSLDWRGLKKEQVIANVLPKLKEGYIILQHCAADSAKENLSGTIEALPEIIKTAKNKGFQFVTVNQLLKTANQ